MDMKTIAEFVETDEIKNKLIEIGVDYAQGNRISKPEPFDKLLKR
jgi:EAL domain-containing protein (putative c-di-GMP-specific phosphodiesterase class I)